MAGEARREEIREIQKQYKWHYVVTAVVAALGIGIWIGAAVFAEDSTGYWMNLATEGMGVIVGIAITALVIDRINERRGRQRLMARLIVDAGSRSNDKAIDAIEQLRDKEWLLGDDGLLKGQRLSEADLRKANLRSANMREADLWKTNLQKADLWWTELQGAFLVQAELQNARLLGAKLQDADLRAAILQGADLTGADLGGADLTDANLQDANLRMANLEGATLHTANLHGADLGKVNLKSADIVGANLQDAILDRANLKKAIMRNVNLENADLLGAYMEGASVSLTEVPVARRWGGPGEPGRFKLLSPTALRGAKLPDGTAFPEDTPFRDELERFTNPEHPEFQKTLEKIKEIHRAWEEVE